jgi:Tfp pilus assembly protein PilF
VTVPRLAQRLAPLAALLAIGAAGAALLGARARRVDVAPGDRLLLADVSVAAAAGDTTLGTALLAAATTALEPSRRVRLHPRARVPAVLRLMRLDDRGEPLTYELAREVAERDGARFVLGLWVDRAGGGYTVAARLADVPAGRDVAESRATAASADDLVGALGRALADVTRRVGEPARDGAAPPAPLPRVTTGSLEALRAYAAGARAWDGGDYPRARELWLRAVDLDTGFAMALGALGGLHYYTHDRAEGERYFGEALARAARLTPLEALRLRERRARFRGDVDSAAALSAAIAELHPSAEAWAAHGTNLMRRRAYAEAVVALGRSVALDSTRDAAWINLATTYLFLDRLPDALRAYERAGAADSTSIARGNVGVEYGGTLARVGRVAAAESVFRGMAESPRLPDRALGLRALGHLAAWQGRLDDAIEAFRRAVATTHQMKAPLSEGRNRLLLAAALRTAGRDAEANDELSRTLALAASPAFEPVMLALVAFACERHGRPADAAAVAESLRARVDSANPADRAAAAFADGVVHLARRRPDSALAALRRADGFPFPMPRLALLASAHEAAGRRDSARAAWRALIADRHFGVEGIDEALRAPLRLGDLLAQAGDTSGAAARYREVLTQWQAAPRDLPALAAARARLRALRLAP